MVLDFKCLFQRKNGLKKKTKKKKRKEGHKERKTIKKKERKRLTEQVVRVGIYCIYSYIKRMILFSVKFYMNPMIE